MPKIGWIAIIAALVLFVISIGYGTRFAAGGGALLLLAAIVYATARNKAGGEANRRAADRGAERVQDEVERDQHP